MPRKRTLKIPSWNGETLLVVLRKLDGDWTDEEIENLVSACVLSCVERRSNFPQFAVVWGSGEIEAIKEHLGRVGCSIEVTMNPLRLPFIPQRPPTEDDLQRWQEQYPSFQP
jgi:hypothetical protein